MEYKLEQTILKDVVFHSYTKVQKYALQLEEHSEEQQYHVLCHIYIHILYQN